MTDIVERLRRKVFHGPTMEASHTKTVEWQAADEIERLRAALEPFAKAADGFDMQRISNPEEWFAYGGIRGNDETVGAITVGDLRRARAALEQGVKPNNTEEKQ